MNSPDPISQRPETASLSDHDLLIRIDERTSHLGKSYIELAQLMSAIRTEAEVRDKALELRIDEITTWRANLMGKMTIVVGLASLVGTIIVNLALRLISFP